MADFFTQFACRLEVGTSSNAKRALALYEEMSTALEKAEGSAFGFHVMTNSTTVGSLLIRDTDGHGDPEHVIAFVLRCAEVLDLHGQWGFAWALTCSKPRLDGFGGGAQLLDLGARRSLAWIDCEHWLTAQSAPTATFGRTS